MKPKAKKKQILGFPKATWKGVKSMTDNRAAPTMEGITRSKSTPWKGKKRNPADTTMRNINALKKRVKGLENRISSLERLLRGAWGR